MKRSMRLIRVAVTFIFLLGILPAWASDYSLHEGALAEASYWLNYTRGVFIKSEGVVVAYSMHSGGETQRAIGYLDPTAQQQLFRWISGLKEGPLVDPHKEHPPVCGVGATTYLVRLPSGTIQPIYTEPYVTQLPQEHVPEIATILRGYLKIADAILPQSDEPS